VVVVAHAFQLRCLGGPSLLSAAGEQVRFRTRKHFALLVRLALEPGKRFTRDYLTDLLWPTAAPRLANHSLAQGLSVIKAKVAREAVLIQRATVGLAPGWVDVDALRLGNGDVGIDGPFLDGFEIPAARPFEEWKDECRARLLPQVRDCLVRQMDAARRIGDFATVERRAERLQELDPLAEESIRGVMEARAWAGDRSNALKAFARYEAQLAEELGAKPGADLVRMADLLRDGRRSSPRPTAPGAAVPGPELIARRFEPETLIGREREFSVLYDAWIEARRKTPRIVVMTGDPGVGKTTLANAFVSSCQMDGAVVARAQAYDAERELPFAVLGELVKQLASQRAIGGADPEALSELTRITTEIVRVFPGVPKPVDWAPEITPLRLADAFLKTVTSAAEDSPVVLVVDDIHAADNASTAILHVVARKLVDARVLVILTGRTSELRLSGAPAALTSDSSIEGMRALEVDVLPAEAAERLVRRLAAAAEQPDPPADRILRVSGGNPLAIELLTREWAAHGPGSLLRDLEALNTQPVPTLGIPRAIGAVFDRQSRRLDPATRAALDLAALLGRRLADLALYAAVDLSPGQAAEALSRLKDEGLLREVRGDLEFRNELIRAQAYYAVAGPARQHLHRSVGELLAARPPQENKPVGLEIAWHYLRGGESARAVPFAHQGAEAFLAVGAPHEAEEILRAIGDADQPIGTARRTRLLLAKALLDQSKADDALPLVERLANDEMLSLHERAEVARLRASAEYSLNREPGEKYCELAREALAVSQRTGDQALIARALLECARAGAESGLTELVAIAQAEAQELGQLEDTNAMRMVSLTKGYCSLFFKDADAALQNLRSAADLSSHDISHAHLAFILSGIGTSLIFLGRLEEAQSALLTALGLATRFGDDARASIVASNLCLVNVSRGEYEKAIRFGEMSVACGTRGATNNPILIIGYTNLADAFVLSGRTPEAVQCMEKAARWLNSERTWKVRCAFLASEAAFALTQGNDALALDVITQIERFAHGREDAFPLPGAYWKLKLYRAAHIGAADEALAVASRVGADLRAKCPFYYLDVLAVKAWLERRVLGRQTEQTDAELEIFETLQVKGKKALLVAQGFLA
jgi:DNA-binding SARP family transcriptional activator/tetratricopeptide (TPR) repeat protein